MGQCRYSHIAPEWGEFYEVTGDLQMEKCPNDWIDVGPPQKRNRHFLFYFRDETFECDAMDWKLEFIRAR